MCNYRMTNWVLTSNAEVSCLSKWILILNSLSESRKQTEAPSPRLLLDCTSNSADRDYVWKSAFSVPNGNNLFAQFNYCLETSIDLLCYRDVRETVFVPSSLLIDDLISYGSSIQLNNCISDSLRLLGADVTLLFCHNLHGYLAICLTNRYWSATWLILHSPICQNS